MQKAQAQALSQGPASPPQQPLAPQTPGQQTQGISPTSTGQHPFAMSNPTALAYAAQQITMPQMNMNMGMGMSNGSCGHQPSSTMTSEKPEKKPRKKWTMEETQMLVAGCNKVRRRVVSGICRVRPNLYWCVVAAAGYYVEGR